MLYLPVLHTNPLISNQNYSSFNINDHQTSTFQSILSTSPFHFSSTPVPHSPLRSEVQPKDLAKILWIYLGPCIFVIGIVGNLLIIMVMGQPSMKGTSTCTYLRWMAVADISTLLTGMIPEWLEHKDIVVLKDVNPTACKMEKFLNFCSADTSIWICVVFTIDRFVAVCLPMFESSLFHSNNAKFHVAVAFAAAVIKNAHVLWTRGAEYEAMVYSLNSNSSVTAALNETQYYSQKTDPSPIFTYKLVSNCGSPTEEFKKFEKYVRPWIAFVAISLIPCLIIIICNIFIVRSLLLLKLNKNKIPSNSESGTVLQMTVLCLTASVCFLVCNTPSMIMLIGKPYWNVKYNNIYNLAKPIINQIFYVNHSVNFFLYCITGKRFRQSLSFVCCRRRHASYSCDVSRRDLLCKSSRRKYRRQFSSNSSVIKSPVHSPLAPPWTPRLTEAKEVPGFTPAPALLRRYENLTVTTTAETTATVAALAATSATTATANDNADNIPDVTISSDRRNPTGRSNGSNNCNNNTNINRNGNNFIYYNNSIYQS